MTYTRFAIYDAPIYDALASFGATWLGWDVRTGSATCQADVPDLDDITMTPRNYGFHGTLKPPFRLANGHTVDDLRASAADLAGRCATAQSGGLQLTTLGGFLALTPTGDLTALERLASACVRDLDSFRAPASDAELARRRSAGLSARQEALMLRWGYPYVLEEFRFHLTLSGRLPEADRAAWVDTARTHLPPMAERYEINSIALCGERPDGRFELIQRYALAG
jgi:putative phosphonate metabolism protein